jgi:hypothetical protein
MHSIMTGTLLQLDYNDSLQASHVQYLAQLPLGFNICLSAGLRL